MSSFSLNFLPPSKLTGVLAHANIIDSLSVGAVALRVDTSRILGTVALGKFWA